MDEYVRAAGDLDERGAIVEVTADQPHATSAEIACVGARRIANQRCNGVASLDGHVREALADTAGNAVTASFILRAD